MAPTGGSATINGILYQILGSIHWAGITTIKSQKAGEDINEALLVIEPLRGGGDLQVHAQGEKLVQQWKCKSNQGTWSLYSLVESVFPDLYLAVGNALDDHIKYQFITEGREGRWGLFVEFLEEIREHQVPENPLSLISDDTSVQFHMNKRKYSRKSLFLEIVKNVRKRKESSQEPIEESYRKVWHLLRNFQFEGGHTKDGLVRKINNLLLRSVGYSEDVDAKRRELCGLITEKASQGEARISPMTLFEDAGLNINALRSWNEQLKRAQGRLTKNINRTGYVAEQDVRKPCEWPDDKSALILSGESGQGKTWQLANLAKTISEQGDLVAFISATGDSDKDLRNAANEVWKHIFDHDSSLDLERICSRLTKTGQPLPSPWLWVAIDDVQSMKEARELLDFNWPSINARLILTVPAANKTALSLKYNDQAHFVDTEDFSISELRQYLELRNQPWADIPGDVRETLRRPLLANLYCDGVISDPSWLPTYEYQLYERYWQRITTEREQADHPQDRALLLTLLADLLEPHSVYPWSDTVLLRAGITNEIRIRLEAIGWLRRDAQGNAAIWHDRLLNWGVAEAIVGMRLSNRITTQGLQEKLDRCSESNHPNGVNLGYVPMDVLWLISSHNSITSSEVAGAISSIVLKSRNQGFYQDLYKELLPTLGGRIIPGLIEHVRINHDGFNPSLSPVAEAIVKIGGKAPAEVERVALECLADPSSDIKRLALYILIKFPKAEAIDPVWGIHKEHAQTLYDSNIHGRHQSYSLSFSALRVCIGQKPEWLETEILQCDSSETPVHELAWQLNSLHSNNAHEMWERVKPTLLSKVFQDKPRSLISCIRRFRDKSEIPRLISWLNEEKDHANESSLAALSVLSPDIALEQIENLPDNSLYMTRSWWLPELLIRKPTEIREKLRSRLVGDSTFKMSLVYQGHENDMDIETVDILLNQLDQDIDWFVSQPPPRNKHWWHIRLSLLAEISRHELLAAFEARAGTKLERKLLELASSWLDEATNHLDRELRSASKILLKIGGAGIVELVMNQLNHKSYYARLDGFKYIGVANRNDVEPALERIVFDSDNPENHDTYLALLSLAAIKAEGILVKAVLKVGWKNLPVGIVDHLSGDAPFSDSAIEPALISLRSATESEVANGIFALAVAKRAEYIPEIIERIKHANSDSDLNLAAVLSFDCFGHTSSEIITFLAKQLEEDKHRKKAEIALINIGSKDALDKLESYIASRASSKSIDQNIAEMAAVLTRFPERKRQMLEIVWSYLSAHSSIINSGFYELVGEIDEPDVYEFLLEKAYGKDNGIHISGEREAIIRGLAKRHPDVAFDAAVYALNDHENISDLLPNLLVELNANDAIPELCMTACAEVEKLVLWAIGKALRFADQAETVSACLSVLILSGEWQERAVAAELAGWQAPGFLGNDLYRLAMDDDNETVRRIAIKAIAQQKEQTEIQLLFGKFRSANSIQKWSYLDSIIQLGDPDILQRRDDPLWLGNILAEAPYRFVEYAKEKLKKRTDEVKKKADEIERSKRTYV